jgi:hypothetical protein
MEECSSLCILDINCVSNYGTFKSYSYNEYREFEYVHNMHKICTPYKKRESELSAKLLTLATSVNLSMMFTKEPRTLKSFILESEFFSREMATRIA